jgi:quercetin dioxygenase-like cupin family protein
MTETPVPGPIAWDDLPERQIIPGFVGRFIHSERLTFALWRFAKGAVLPLHSHPHEQVIHVLDGELAITLGGVRHHLGPGMVLVIPPDAPHEGVMLTDARVMDVFCPVRDDYRDGATASILGAALE